MPVCGGDEACLGTIPGEGIFFAFFDRTIKDCCLCTFAKHCTIPNQRDASKGGGGASGGRGGGQRVLWQHTMAHLFGRQVQQGATFLWMGGMHQGLHKSP